MCDCGKKEKIVIGAFGVVIFGNLVCVKIGVVILSIAVVAGIIVAVVVLLVLLDNHCVVFEIVHFVEVLEDFCLIWGGVCGNCEIFVCVSSVMSCGICWTRCCCD